jgi:hypothetical protein
MPVFACYRLVVFDEVSKRSIPPPIWFDVPVLLQNFGLMQRFAFAVPC